uniref:Uncharacterized protein n=2 Tax=Hemiselmis andersenii TaxID=464988 RepID=A0A6U4N2Z6_HEMAN|mmetsp:Transcript_39769/g.96695  ORF Transcript_39769/g.96695 Transcript_39769/m.96695 type:complete len:211 (+) Transcript_39769:70-702(+)
MGPARHSREVLAILFILVLIPRSVELRWQGILRLRGGISREEAEKRAASIASRSPAGSTFQMGQGKESAVFMLCGEEHTVQAGEVDFPLVQNEGGITALHLAAAEGEVSVVEGLLELGARTEVGNSDDGDTACHLAAFHGQVQVLRVLAAHGADLGARNFFGATPMHAAAAAGHAEVVKWLQSQGCSGDVKDEEGYTPLDFAGASVAEGL